MDWTDEANQAVSRVPFFVRKRVKKRVEEEALRCSAKSVTMEHVRTCQQRYLKNMEDEVKGYQVENWGAILGSERSCLGFTTPMRHSTCWSAALTSINSGVAMANDSGKSWSKKERNA